MIMHRKSNVFGEFVEADKDFELKIITRFPEKWVLIDTENNQAYQGTKNSIITKIWNKVKVNNHVEEVIEYIEKN